MVSVILIKSKSYYVVELLVQKLRQTRNHTKLQVKQR